MCFVLWRVNFLGPRESANSQMPDHKTPEGFALSQNPCNLQEQGSQFSWTVSIHSGVVIPSGHLCSRDLVYNGPCSPCNHLKFTGFLQGLVLTTRSFLLWYSQEKSTTTFASAHAHTCKTYTPSHIVISCVRLIGLWG